MHKKILLLVSIPTIVAHKITTTGIKNSSRETQKRYVRADCSIFSKSLFLLVLIIFFFAPQIVAQTPLLNYNPASYSLTLGDVLQRCIPISDGGPIPTTPYGAVTTFAGSPSAAAGYINATGNAARFNRPMQVAGDASGNLYIADANNNAIRKISQTGVVTTFAGSSTGVSGFQDGVGTSALFNSPEGIIIDHYGDMFVSDYKNNAIREITPNGTVTTFYKSSTVFGPAGLCIDDYEHLIVAARDANQVISITNTGVATILAGSTAGYTNGRFNLAQFNKPFDVAYDGNGGILVADFNNNAIRRINQFGYVSTFAGSDVAGNIGGYTNGVGTTAIFNRPTGITSGPNGAFYVTERVNNDIRLITSDGKVTLLAGSKVHAPGDADGMIPAVTFNTPNRLGFDNIGEAYVVEPGTNTIRKINLTGYAIKGPIPPGLTFDTATGIMTGKITTAFTTCVDTVTAYNVAGSATATLTFNYEGAPSSISTLSTIKLSIGGQFQYYVGSRTDYAVDESYATSSVIFTPTPTEPNEIVTVNGNNPATPVNLVLGVNNVIVKSTSQDGTSSNTYTFEVTKHPLYDATLTNLATDKGTLSPVFNSNINDYTVNLPGGVSAGVTDINLVGAPWDYQHATFTMNGNPARPYYYVDFLLRDTSYMVTITVTAADGLTTKTYNVLLPPKQYPSTLSNLAVSTGLVDPVFASGTKSYTTSVANTTSALTVIPTATDPAAFITVNGASAAAPVNLAIGDNTISVKITSRDSTSTTTYTVAVTRAGPMVPTVPGKSPIIAYGTGKATITGTIPFSLQPTNTGGAVPKTVYGKVTTFAGSPMVGYNNGRGNKAEFDWPQDMAKDASGNLYVTDSYNNNMRKITPDGVVSTYAGSPTGKAGNANGKDTSARFSFPNGLAFDSFGNLYVADLNNNMIRRVSPGGVVSTFYSDSTRYFLNFPGPMIFDKSGNMIVVGQGSFNILKISPSGVGTVLAGNWGPPYTWYINGPVAQAQFAYPSDIRADTSGNMYVADANNNAIRKITSGGIVSTFAGSQVANNTGAYANGVDTAARFNYPVGVEVGPGGMIYVTDMYNNDIRKITPGGIVSLLAGSPTQAAGDNDGVATAALFNLPTYIRIDNTGTGYISEEGGNRIRKILLTGYSINGPSLPAGITFDATTGTIAGKVMEPFATQTDTITAYNAFGYSTAIVTLSYHPPSPTLSNLKISSGTLTPVFASETDNYTANVSNATTNITVTPTTTNNTTTLTVNGIPVTSGTASAAIPLAVGSNIITTVVTAQDGITTDTYTATVTRAASDYAFLSDLQLSNGTLTPPFTNTTLSYSDRVSRATYSITVIPTTLYDFETVTVNGDPVTSGTASLPISLTDGLNNISIVVTAQNGIKTRTYSLSVTKESGDLAADGITVHPGISPNGDGINDVLVIDGIDAYPKNKLSIMNLNGELIFETEGYDNNSKVFDGHSNRNGLMQKPGTYFYSLEYTVDNEKRYCTGFLVIKY
jgi:gliding motility-associated-like protein